MDISKMFWRTISLWRWYKE